MTKFMMANFQSQNVRSPLIVKQERSLHNVPEWNNYIVHMLPQNNFNNSHRKVQNLRIKFTKLRF